MSAGSTWCTFGEGFLSRVVPPSDPAHRRDVARTPREFATVDADGVDHHYVDRDDHHRPHWCGGHEGEVDGCADDGQSDADETTPHLSCHECDAGQCREHSDGQVGPTPCCVVDADEQSARGHDVVGVAEQGRESLNGLEDAHHNHHQAGEENPPRPPRGRRGAFVLVDRYSVRGDRRCVRGRISCALTHVELPS